MATESTKAPAPPTSSSDDDLHYYTCDDAALDAVRKSCPWKDDPAYFKKVSLSPSSVMKMVNIKRNHKSYDGFVQLFDFFGSY